MTERTYSLLMAAWGLVGLIIFIILLYISAPYGRHTRKGWGLKIPNRLAWVIMELPSLLAFTWFFFAGEGNPEPVTWIFFTLWIAHYTHRSLIFPFRIRTRGKKMPLVIALFAIFFNVVNGSFNGSYFSMYGPDYSIEWLADARFLLGLLLFGAGAWINISSDHLLMKLRNNSDGEYRLPKGRLFRYVSCPNYFGEIIQWSGFAVMTWSPAALTFALWTFFNLVPRALEHHRWYKNKFPGYPEKRKAVIPGLV